VRSYPDVVALGERGDRDEEPAILVPLRIELGGRELSLFTTLTTFGTPRDITLDEVAVELFFPADDATDAILRGV
jgi:MmyB-like transcription regulator ligand binding domain